MCVHFSLVPLLICTAFKSFWTYQSVICLSGSTHPSQNTPTIGSGGSVTRVYSRDTQKILLPSAAHLKEGSQSANRSVSQASSQSDNQSSKQAGKQKQTVWVFLVADSATSSRESNTCEDKRWSNGNASDHRLAGRWFKSRPTPPPAVPAGLSPRSNPSEHKLTFDPPASPPQKSDIQFQGI